MTLTPTNQDRPDEYLERSTYRLSFALAYPMSLP